MNDLNHIHRVQALTQELHSLNSEIQSSTFNGHEYEILSNKLTAHQIQVQDICRHCIEQQSFSDELDNYSKEFTISRKLLPAITFTGDKITHAVHHKFMSIDSKLKETRIIVKLPLAFKLNEAEIREKLPTNYYARGFFYESANLCFNLANQRLSQPEPLDVEEINAIHDALFDSTVRTFIPESFDSSNFIQPHPAYVFENLQKLLTSVEGYGSFDDIQSEIKTYLESKPIPSQAIQNLLIYSQHQQETALIDIRLDASQGDAHAISFIEDLDTYQTHLKIFTDGLKNFPIVNVKILLKESININETFFLVVDQKTSWVFKPVLMNFEEGYEIYEAECTASRLNYDHKFPIPLTIPLSIKGSIGSAQLYIENSQKIDQISRGSTSSSPLFVNREQLHKLAIFDLLFANSDRHEDNFLFINSDDLPRIVGIDHDSCLMFRGIKPLKLDYLQLADLDYPLHEDTATLFSMDAINHYKTIMQETRDIQELHYQYTWLNIVTETLIEALDEQTPLREVILSLQSRYEEEFLN